jgi:hypothetical protein
MVHNHDSMVLGEAAGLRGGGEALLFSWPADLAEPTLDLELP